MVEEEIMSASTAAGVADSEDTTREAKAAAREGSQPVPRPKAG